MIVNEELCNKLEWIKWAKRDGVYLKYAGKKYRIADCNIEGFKSGEKVLKLNAMLNHLQDNVDNIMNLDFNYLCSIHDRSNILMIYHYEINKMQGIVLVDMRVSKNYISARFAKNMNLRFIWDKVDSLYSIRLLNE